MRAEPTIIINSVTAAIEAIILATVAFGLNLSGDQVAAIMGAVLAIGGVVQTLLVRSSVFAVDTVEEIVANVAMGRDAGLMDL